ncbi:MAG TPA: hypothetical protein VE221_08470, partial [Sphingomicrobium sp.]|nr:hypothetical protein [Sphingomicrobium sp.]
LTATVLILFAAFCLIAAIWREFNGLPRRARLNVVPRSLLIPVNMFLVLATLAALVGVWMK